MKIFGPVPSRRLGKSLGVNTLAEKFCTYSCVYCQIGKTPQTTTTRKAHSKPSVVIEKVQKKMEILEKNDKQVDIITFIPNGETTLDTGLGEEILGLKELGFRVGAITNSSLISNEQVRSELSNLDWVSLKVDAVDRSIWKNINRPDKELDLDDIQNGIIDFSKQFNGELVTETMMIQGVNDSIEHFENLGFFLKEAGIRKSYLSSPTRPPAESWVKPADPPTMYKAAGSLIRRGITTELLVDFEGSDFTLSNNSYKDIMDIVSVHPIREDALRQVIIEEGLDWKEIETMLRLGLIKSIDHTGHRFYVENT